MLRPKQPKKQRLCSRLRNLASEMGVPAIRTMRWGYNRKLHLTALDCIPVNRFVTEREFGRISQVQKSESLVRCQGDHQKNDANPGLFIAAIVACKLVGPAEGLLTTGLLTTGPRDCCSKFKDRQFRATLKHLDK